MEYIMIDEAKLKIILAPEDLAEWNISADELDYNDPYSKIFFKDILDHAKDSFGFDTTGYKTLLQLFPSLDGGCEIFITRIEEQRHDSGNKTSVNVCEKAYSFDRLSSLISVCKRLCFEGFCGESSVWYDSDGRWFLTLRSTMLCDDLLPLNKLTFISEYGESESPGALSLYLPEYAFSVCEDNATEILGRM